MWKKKPAAPAVGVVIVAAGSSRRMQGIDKQDLWLEGMPVVVRSVRCFEELECVREIVVVCREDFLGTMMDYVKEFDLLKVKTIVKGGATRQESVRNGVAALSDDLLYYAIHDGARPFASQEVISCCIEAAVQHKAATAAVPAKDTIKVADENGFIRDTPPRETLYLTQTPQVFLSSLYREALRQAQKDGIDCTDDCQLVERMGAKVYLSQGSYFNIKITTPEDLPIAQAIVQTLEEA